MAAWPYPVIDCDGHLIESISELAEHLDPELRAAVLNPSREREGAFPSIDGFHGPRIQSASDHKPVREYVTASDERKGSGEDFLGFVDKAGLEQAILFTSEGLSVGFIQSADYAVRICRAYNDYVYHRYRRLSDRLYPMALIPFQDPTAAVQELRRAVTELKLPGAMVPSTGLPLHLGHELYWPIYKEATDLDCVLGFHGGSALGVGMDTFSNFAAVGGMHHSLGLLQGLAAMIGHGVMERYPGLRVGFFEGGCAWLVLLLDRLERNESVRGSTAHGGLFDCLERGRILVGCEGNDGSLPYLAKRVGPAPFAWASDYPHEVDLVAARQMIDETIHSTELSEEDKRGALGENARRFFKLPVLAAELSAASR
jgi:predicted TIM-barrel fold metal-dependent hydrolase